MSVCIYKSCSNVLSQANMAPQEEAYQDDDPLRGASVFAGGWLLQFNV